MGLTMAGQSGEVSSLSHLRRSQAPIDPALWLAEHEWKAELSSAREVLAAHGRIPHEINAGKAEVAHRPRGILVHATNRLSISA